MPLSPAGAAPPATCRQPVPSVWSAARCHRLHGRNDAGRAGREPAPGQRLQLPGDYGPRSPTFSRAALVYPAGQEILFISGTASIVGHQTVHPGDVVGQCRESMENIAAVLAEATGCAARRPLC